jgi:hypothetical protein
VHDVEKPQKADGAKELVQIGATRDAAFLPYGSGQKALLPEAD